MWVSEGLPYPGTGWVLGEILAESRFGLCRLYRTERGTGEKRRGGERERNSNREPTIAGQWHSRLQRPSVIKVGFPSPPSHPFGFSLDANCLFRPRPVGKPTPIPACDPALVFPGGRHLAQLHHLAPLSGPLGLDAS